ncbi:MAG: uroporphyrinogen-III synthase [Blastochloris viridis]|uniref:Uroporphyrinogen-III synthase n=1 Tax=Blastochloris viridis TaxID=1079 RepID=A0A6N4RCA2_BLAVI|nr:MAG: uroporphyrinogen-III synthase [Blastochloris viridis]
MILISRPRPHMQRTLQTLQNAGITPENIVSFVLAEPETLPISIPSETTALILTSPLACPALAVHPQALTLPVYAVGPTTAEAARALGADVVLIGTDNGHTMAHDICQQETRLQTFAHLHGDHAGMDWHTILTDAGHTVTPLAAYHTHHVEALPTAVAQRIAAEGFPAFTLLFSAGSARHLANLLKHANITPSGTALCLSEAVATEASTHWPHTRIASQPTLEAVVALLAQAEHE